MRFRTALFVLTSLFAYVLLPCSAHGADRPRFKVRVGMSTGWLPKEDVSRFAFSTNRGVSFDELIFDQFESRGLVSVILYSWGQPTITFYSFAPIVAGGTFPFYGEGSAASSAVGVPVHAGAAMEVAKGWWVEGHVALSERRELALDGWRSYAYFGRVRPTEAISFRPTLVAEARHQREDESHVVSNSARVIGIECVREIAKIGRALLLAGAGIEHWTLVRGRNGWTQVSAYNQFMVKGSGGNYLLAPPEGDWHMIRFDGDAPGEAVGVIRPYATGSIEVALARRIALDAQVRIYARGSRSALPAERLLLWGTFSPEGNLPESTISFSLGYTF